MNLIIGIMLGFFIGIGCATSASFMVLNAQAKNVVTTAMAYETKSIVLADCQNRLDKLDKRKGKR